MINQSKLPIVQACSALPIGTTTYYRWKKNQNRPDSNKKTRKEIQGVALEFPKYGYRRITKSLHRKNIQINHKKVLRIMREEGLICKKKKFKPITTQSNHGLKTYPNLIKNLELTNLNQVWVSDITYIHLLNEFIYLAVIIDLFSRKCIGWDLSRNIDAELTLSALNMALQKRKHLGFEKLIHHSDQGVQYAANDYVKILGKHGVRISMSEQGNVYDNAFAESFIKTLKIEEVYMNEYIDFEDVYTNIKKFIDGVYNKKRLHSSIGYLPPDEFEKEVLNKCML